MYVRIRAYPNIYGMMNILTPWAGMLPTFSAYPAYPAYPDPGRKALGLRDACHCVGNMPHRS